MYNSIYTTNNCSYNINITIKSNETIRFNGILFNCYEVYEDGIKGYIPIDTCTVFQQRIERIENNDSSTTSTTLSEKETGCTCIPKSNNNINDNSNGTIPTNITNESPVTSPKMLLLQHHLLIHYES